MLHYRKLEKEIISKQAGLRENYGELLKHFQQNISEEKPAKDYLIR